MIRLHPASLALRLVGYGAGLQKDGGMGSGAVCARLSDTVNDVVERMIAHQANEVVLVESDGEADDWGHPVDGIQGRLTLPQAACVARRQALGTVEPTPAGMLRAAEASIRSGECPAAGCSISASGLVPETATQHRRKSGDPRLRVVGMITASELLRWTMSCVVSHRRGMTPD